MAGASLKLPTGKISETEILSGENESGFFFTDFLQTQGNLEQGQARGYGHITQQYLIFGRTTGGQHFQLEYLQRYLKNCFASFIL